MCNTNLKCLTLCGGFVTSRSSEYYDINHSNLLFPDPIVNYHSPDWIKCQRSTFAKLSRDNYVTSKHTSACRRSDKDANKFYVMLFVHIITHLIKSQVCKRKYSDILRYTCSLWQNKNVRVCTFGIFSNFTPPYGTFDILSNSTYGTGFDMFSTYGTGGSEGGGSGTARRSPAPTAGFPSGEWISPNQKSDFAKSPGRFHKNHTLKPTAV